MEPIKNLLPVRCETRLGQAPNVLEQHCTRPGVRDNLQCLRKKISLVVSTELLACNRKRRARHATGKEINTLIVAAIEVMDVHLHDIPPPLGGKAIMVTVDPQSLTRVLIIFDSANMPKASLFQTQSLTAGTCTNLQRD